MKLTNHLQASQQIFHVIPIPKLITTTPCLPHAYLKAHKPEKKWEWTCNAQLFYAANGSLLPAVSPS